MLSVLDRCYSCVVIYLLFNNRVYYFQLVMPRTHTSEKARVRRVVIKAFSKAQALLDKWAGRQPDEGAPQREVRELLDRTTFILTFWESYDKCCPLITVFKSFLLLFSL